MRIAFVLPGLHRVNRGAEVALESVAIRLAARHDVTLFGSGFTRANAPYRFKHVGAVPRERFERFPAVPTLRDECAYEEATWIPGLLCVYRPREFDVVVGCSYPFTHWFLRARRSRAHGPRLVYVTQNGDWPVQSSDREYRFFDADGVLCVNPEHLERNNKRYPCALAPNGVDTSKYVAGPGDRDSLGLPLDKPIVLMASSLIESKRVIEAMRAVARVPEAHFVIAGDGPLRDQVARVAAEYLPGRFTRLTLGHEAMPNLYRCANVFVHASKNESFGLVYAEAMATGLPVVAHRTPHTEWILGECDLNVDTDDATAFTSAIQRALSDTDAGKRNSRRARENFSWDAISVQYEEFLFDVVRRANDRGACQAGLG